MTKTYSQGRAKSEQSIEISIEQSNTTSSSRRNQTIVKVAKLYQQGQDKHSKPDTEVQLCGEYDCKYGQVNFLSDINQTANIGKLVQI